MKSQTKDRIKLFSLLAVCIFIIGYSVFGIFGPKVATSVTTGSKVVDAADTKNILILNERNESYAVKLREDNKFYLLFYRFGDVKEGKYKVTKEQYNKLKSFDYYWFTIRYYKPYDGKTGVVKTIYTYNPSIP